MSYEPGRAKAPPLNVLARYFMTAVLSCLHTTFPYQVRTNSTGSFFAFFIPNPRVNCNSRALAAMSVPPPAFTLVFECWHRVDWFPVRRVAHSGVESAQPGQPECEAG